MKLSELGEFGLIRRIQSRFATPGGGALGIGDDCAVLPLDGARVQLVTTDLLIENIHFLRNRISAEDLGHKALAVNLSDIAAMGGAPTGAFLSVGFPPDLEVDWLDRFFAGIQTLADASACPLLGGDTTRSEDRIVINFAVLGAAARGEVKYRSTARPGDRIAVTGDLGDSAAGLRVLLAGGPTEAAGGERRLVVAHHRPRPHLEEGQWLARREAVHAMMDVSDGIDSDLRRIMEQSGIGVAVDLDALPMSDALRTVCAARGWSAADLAAAGGEDYCLLCTVEPRAFPELARAFEARFGRPLHAIGTVREESALSYRFDGRPAKLAGHGFDHFTS